jgi:DeoR/GlpR family transcriptional regulator of sugar metabolism
LANLEEIEMSAMKRQAGGGGLVPTKGAAARKQAILTLLRSEGFYSTLGLASKFSVSEMTIRRDILDLELEGLVRRVHGGATSINNSSLIPTDFRERAKLNFLKKVAIAQTAMNYISRGDIIAFDAGSTTLEICRILPKDLVISVVTHSLPAINELVNYEKIKLYAIGGELHLPTQSFSSLDSAQLLSEFRVTTLFLSAGSIRNGSVYCATPYEAVIKKALIDSAERVVLVSDSTKFLSNAMVKVCDLSRINTLITDDEILPEQVREFKQFQNLELIEVNASLIGNEEKS